MYSFSVLALKGIDYEYRAVNLMKDGGQQVHFLLTFPPMERAFK